MAKVDPEVVAEIAQDAVPEEWDDPTFGQQYLDNALRLNVSVTDMLGGLKPDTGVDPAGDDEGSV